MTHCDSSNLKIIDHLVTPEVVKEVQKDTIKWMKEIGATTRRICDLRYLIIEDCFYMKLFQECPNSRFKNSKWNELEIFDLFSISDVFYCLLTAKKCNNLLSFVQRCDDWY